MVAPLFTRRNAIAGLALGGTVGLAAATTSAVLPRFQVEDHRGRSTADRETIRRAISAAVKGGGGEIHFAPGRHYMLGELKPDESAFLLKDLRGLRFIGHGAKLHCQTAGNGQTQLFLAQRCSDIAFEDLSAIDVGGDTSKEWRGMDFLHCDTTSGPVSRVRLSDIRVERAVSALTITGDARSARASGFLLERVIADSCYYGVSAQENGDALRGDLTALNCRRAYFAYGVRDHAINLAVSSDGRSPGGDAAILIKRYLLDTANIRVDARFSGTLTWRNLAKVEQQPPSGQSGRIEDVAIHLQVDPDTRNPLGSAALGVSAYRSGRQISRSNDIWRNISLAGCLGPLETVTRYYSRSSVAADRVKETIGDCA